jgi:hypothetical protein
LNQNEYQSQDHFSRCLDKIGSRGVKREQGRAGESRREQGRARESRGDQIRVEKDREEQGC